jgi:ATP-dependent DNA helicase HFM1/MER3
MMGRAGRPQYEKEGSVVIMCERSKVNKMEYFLEDNFPGNFIKSNFELNFADNLNNEIS